MIDGENGFLPLLTFDAMDNWNTLLQLANPELDSDGVARLMQALSGTTKAIAVERHYIDKDYRDTFSNFHSKRFSTPDSRCLRLHFFSRAIARDELKDAGKIQADYLGYAIIRPTRPNCLGRTLLRPESRSTVSGSMRLCDETITLQGTELRVRGFPFISQDADVTVCAQSALWMIVRYYSNRYPLYPERFPYQLAKLTEDYSLGRVIPSSGLYLWQMAEALRRIGFSPVTYTRDRFTADFDHLLYTYVESGIPVILATKRHALVAFGHKSDYALPNPILPQCARSAIFSGGGDDITRLPLFVEKLQKQSDPVSAFLVTRLPRPTVASVTKFTAATGDGKALAEVLVEDLNAIILGPSIYEQNRFKGVTLCQEASALLHKNPAGIGLAWLNRLLLEDAFPLELSRNHHSYSSQFNHAFVVNDDNRIPYQLLRDKKQGTAGESKFEFKDVESFVAPLAEKIFLPAESFQKVVKTILDRGDVGYKALSATLSAAPLVQRLFLTTARSFKKRLAERGMGNPIVEEVYRSMPLPHFFWVCEISHMADYLSHNVYGEILWDATRNASEPDGWVALHYPEVLIADLGSASNQRQQLQKYPLQNSQTYPLYRSNLQDVQT